MKMLVNWSIIIGNNTHQLRVTKHRYNIIDYENIHNSTCQLTWAFIGVFESFIRRELKKMPYINVIA